ncbi:beta-galactosidase trimerization domain-containing protein [Saccharibacillus sp. CPCC 101409]|uniref:beta-galactosidase trimerization domain-containing protein n=1 Tax=Saccharibacillus sp. CPCC 101409 TaxID=3058041 RepID=UPI002673C938|nr:beta-galactosidase trimerization domain-containing protein [Saccharibacillus sp. CPCC 101409]MDO3411861.1 beta-galactosidase trimerization domain-containing protein [Saccharibacillus sp. CPCC 101409]
MRLRQVHLDFHTSEHIPDIGRDFSRTQFQDMLKLGRVDSITLFSKCHHGWAYHPSDANEIHPNLEFDLLGAQIEAAHEIGVRTPVYLSAGLDEKLARRKPQWLIRDREERMSWTADFMHPGYHQFCMNTPYLDILADQVRETAGRYDADGIFLDIVGVRECYCQSCTAGIRRRGSDPRHTEDMRAMWEETYFRYTKRMRDAVDSVKPGLPLFHNSGHVARGRRELARVNSHLELESLPTGGWGYDHFPLSARYAQGLGMDVIGMTGKFHHSWGEFGGFKHPNALRYEAALSLANGAGCSIGDQLHPFGAMEPATYALIGEAYAEIEAKEEWCRDTESVAEIALLSAEAAGSDFGLRETGSAAGSESIADAGAVRILLEGHYLFDVVDAESELDRYRVVVLPDCIEASPELERKLRGFVEKGGKLLATGRSGLRNVLESDQKPSGPLLAFAFDFGARWESESAYAPSYIRPDFELPSLRPSAYVVYSAGQEISLKTGGRRFGSRENPFFNRELFAFSSHQHTPSNPQDAGPGITEGADGIYAAWNLFEEYALHGSLPVKQILLHMLDRLLDTAGGARILRADLPAQGIVTLQRQPAEKRWINHLLYASPVRRGRNTEIIEDLPELEATRVALHVDRPVADVYLAPQRTPIPFEQTNGQVSYTVPKWSCHQMVVVQFG